MSVNIEISQSINILQIIIILLPFLSYEPGIKFKVYLVFFPQKVIFISFFWFHLLDLEGQWDYFLICKTAIL